MNGGDAGGEGEKEGGWWVGDVEEVVEVEGGGVGGDVLGDCTVREGRGGVVDDVGGEDGCVASGLQGGGYLGEIAIVWYVCHEDNLLVFVIV